MNEKSLQKKWYLYQEIHPQENPLTMESTDKDQNTSGTGESHTVNTGARQGKVEQGREIQDPANNSSVAPGPSATESSPKDETDKISDYLDSRNFGRKESMLIDRPDADMPVGPFSEYYNMKHKRRGLAVILAYSEFIRGGPSPRDCAFHDSKICEATFKKLHYEVQTHMNLPKRDFLKVLEQVRNSDHRDCDSLVVVFMSHGGLNEKTNREFIWTYDSMVDTSELWINLTPEECPSLAGKPKLFFIQACRGDDTDLGVQLKKPGALRVQTDSIDDATLSEDYAIPLYADLLMMWASYPGMVAFKSQNCGINGSVFLHFLTRVFNEDAHNEDLSSMLLRVTREVAVHYESYMPGTGELDKNKQIPQTVSTLMRKVKFFSRSEEYQVRPSKRYCTYL
ncbi:caspase-1-like isoform X2 [Macrobrachium nipponense]|uniref:caspase-1-like isoform X2 n=1 Tax=Macrobrachium nipponense TaxID=159736 RepID=UPI0030C877F1